LTRLFIRVSLDDAALICGVKSPQAGCCELAQQCEVYGIETRTGAATESTPEVLELAWELIVAANFFTIDAQNMQRIAPLHGIRIFLVKQI
jgi:adenine-specific DNA glycosylase